MKSYPTINLLFKLTEEIEHLKESKELLWELFRIADRGLALDSNLRMRINDHLLINEDE
jgi:hypothetical protein